MHRFVPFYIVVLCTAVDYIKLPVAVSLVTYDTYFVIMRLSEE